MDIKQDLSLTANTGAEPFWHNARYTLRASPDVVHFFSHYIQVELLSDIFEANNGRLARSNRVFTGNGWYRFIDDMYYNAENRRLDPEAIEERVDQIQALIRKIPGNVLEAVQHQT